MDTTDVRNAPLSRAREQNSFCVPVRNVGEVIVDGDIALPYVEHGAADGIPVVLLHGFTDSWRSYLTVLPHLPDHLRAIALSVRGHGEASRPAGYTLAEQSGDLIQFLDSLEIDRAVVVGHSMGTLIGQRFALDHPDRVSALVLAGAVARTIDHPTFEELRQGVGELVDPVDPAFARAFQQSTLARGVPEWFLDMTVRESLKLPARVWKEALRGMLDIDFTSGLPRLTMPCAIFWGDADAVFGREDQRLLRRGLPHATMVEYPGHGHALHWEDPERFARDLAAFVAEAVV